MSRQRFSDKVALITGGGSGIGAATARQIACEGGKVVVTGRRIGPVKALAEEIGGAALAGDTADISHLEEAVVLAEDRFGGLDICIANAALEQFGSVEEIALDVWRKTFEINVDGAMLASRVSIPAMRRRGGGSIVLVASIAAVVGSPHFGAYLTSKAALLGLNRSLAYDFGPEGIRSNVICPGVTITEMAGRFVGEFAQSRGMDVDSAFAELVKHYPLRRAASAAEIAQSIAFLASDESSYVTGANLMADGGSSIVDVGTLAFVQ